LAIAVRVCFRRWNSQTRQDRFRQTYISPTTPIAIVYVCDLRPDGSRWTSPFNQFSQRRHLRLHISLPLKLLPYAPDGSSTISRTACVIVEACFFVLHASGLGSIQLRSKTFNAWIRKDNGSFAFFVQHVLIPCFESQLGDRNGTRGLYEKHCKLAETDSQAASGVFQASRL
jgi:hypothetical protein